MSTSIEWTEETLNLWDGCTKVDPACGFCYIPRTPPLRIARRDFVKGHIPLRFHLERLEQPVRRRKPTMYFVNSISDTFHEDVPDDYIAQLWTMMARCPQHTFQILTKRIERARDLVPQLAIRDGGPLPNVWVGATIGVRPFVHRAGVLRDTFAAVRFISAEPLLGPLVPDNPGLPGPEGWTDFHRSDDRVRASAHSPGLDLTGIDQLIVGGESGSHFKKRPYRFLVDRELRPRADRVNWVRDLRDAAIAAGTAFFFKQWGGPRPKSGGRLLDGRTWDELPTSRAVAA